MIKGCKICGISDADTLNYIINHPSPPQFIGFICNYKKSPRYVELDKLKELINIKKNNCKFVAVLVNPNEETLENIKDLDFDYYQIYDCSPDKVKFIKNRYKKKIITAFTINNYEDIKAYELYKNVSDIYLFDGKGYEKSISFNHSLLENIKFDREVMIAGNIKFDDNLESLTKIADIIDISGGLETSGIKDTSKIKIFLDKINSLNDKN